MENKGKTKNKWMFFGIGVIASLILGWVIFPGLIHSNKEQPVRFSHLKHGQEASLTCQDCHSFRGGWEFCRYPKPD